MVYLKLTNRKFPVELRKITKTSVWINQGSPTPFG